MEPKNPQCKFCGSYKTSKGGIAIMGCGGCLCFLVPPLGILIFATGVIMSIFKTRLYFCRDCKKSFWIKKSPQKFDK